MKPTEQMKLEAYQLLLDASKNIKEAKSHFENILPLVHKGSVLSGVKKIEDVADALEKMIADVDALGKDIDKHAEKLNKQLSPEEAGEAEEVPEEEEEPADKDAEGKDKEEPVAAIDGEGDTSVAVESKQTKKSTISEDVNGFGIPLMDC